MSGRLFGCGQSRVFKRGHTIMALLLVLLVGFGISGCASKEDSEGQQVEVMELRLAHFFPATHPVETDLVQPWIKAVEEATGGKVKVTSYPGETLAKADAIYDGVVTGVADMGISCFAYTRGRFPVLEVFELPGITYENSAVASKVAWEGIQELNPKEVQDTKLMMVMTTGPGDLYTKVPIRSLVDLKGVEIRATGLSAQTLAALGASPQAMPQSDAYEALSKGVVKGNLGPVEVLKGWKQAEVTQYLTQTPFLYNTLFFMNMNQDKWNALDAETQQAITEVNQKFFNEVAMGLWDKQNEAAMKYAVDEKGMEVITLPQEEADQWIKLVEPIQQEYVARMQEQGLDGEGALALTKQLAEKYNQE